MRRPASAGGAHAPLTQPQAALAPRWPAGGHLALLVPQHVMSMACPGLGWAGAANARARRRMHAPPAAGVHAAAGMPLLVAAGAPCCKRLRMGGHGAAWAPAERNRKAWRGPSLPQFAHSHSHRVFGLVQAQPASATVHCLLQTVDAAVHRCHPLLGCNRSMSLERTSPPPPLAPSHSPINTPCPL